MLDLMAIKARFGGNPTASPYNLILTRKIMESLWLVLDLKT